MRGFLALAAVAVIPWSSIRPDRIGTMLVGQNGYISSRDMVVDHSRHAWLRAAAPVHGDFTPIDETATNMRVYKYRSGYSVTLDCLAGVKWPLRPRPRSGYVPVAKFRVASCAPLPQ